VRAVLAEALAKEQEFKRRGREHALPVSFPLPVCLFEHGLCGALNRDGSVAVAPRFDFVDEFQEGRALVRSNGLYGYVDLSGTVVVEPRYPIAGRYRLGFAEVDIDGKSALIDLDGRQVLEPRFAGVVPFTKHVFWVNDGERDSGIHPPGGEEFPGVAFENTGSYFRNRARWGLVDAAGAWIRKPEFRDIAGFDPENDELMWAKADTGLGLIRPDGSWLAEPTFRYRLDLSDDRAEVWRGDRVGYIDHTGQVVIPLKFDINIGSRGFVDGMPAAAAKLGRYIGLIDRSGNWVLEPTYDSIFPRPAGGPAEFRGFIVTRGGKEGLLDASGHVVIGPRLDVSFQSGSMQFTRLCEAGQIIGFVDKKPHFFAVDGMPMNPSRGEVQRPSCDPPYVVKVGEKFGYVDGMLRPITDAKFDDARPFRHGIAAVKLGGKYGLIRADGAWAIEPTFDAVQPLQDNMALAKSGDRAGLVDIGTGAWVTQTRYDDVCALGRGVVGVMLDGKMGAIDASEHVLLAPNYSAWVPLGDFAAVRSHGKWGFVDAVGHAIEASFDDVSRFERGVSWVKSDGEWCAIDRRGNKVPSLRCRTGEPAHIQRASLRPEAGCQIVP
jgi:WG containing repeat